jgi:hypothetical protein
MLGLSIPAVIRRRLVGGGAAPPPFSPVQLGSSLIAWWDANDDTTITLNGSTVSQIADKSGNGRHLAQSNAGLQPGRGVDPNFAGRNVLTMPTRRLDSLAPWLDTTTYAIFLLIAPYADCDVVGVNGIGNPGDILLMRYTGVGRIHHWTGLVGINGTKAVDTSPHLLCQQRNGTSLRLIVDGTIDLDLTSVSLGGGARPFLLGNRSTGGGGNFAFGEGIVTRGDIADADRQRIEGFLAWRSGIQSRLPAGHPYSSSAP